MKKVMNSIFSNAAVILMAALLAINYHIFIVENHFAPAGLNGIATMIQYKSGNYTADNSRENSIMSLRIIFQRIQS